MNMEISFNPDLDPARLRIQRIIEIFRYIFVWWLDALMDMNNNFIMKLQVIFRI